MLFRYRRKKHYLEGSQFFQMLRLSDSRSDFKKPYTRIVESVGFPVIIKYSAERVEEERAVAALERKKAEISVDIAENRDHGKRRKDLTDLMEDADRELYMVRKGETRLFRVSLSFKVLSSKPYELTENSKKIRLYMEMARMKLSESSTTGTAKAFANPVENHGNYLADGFTASYFMPLFFSRPMRSGTFIGIEEVNRRPYLFDPFSGSSYNVLVLGQTGSGKSFFVKLFVRRSTGNRIMILDPLNEYFCAENDKECMEMNLNDGDYIDFLSSMKNEGESISLAASMLASVLNAGYDDMVHDLRIYLSLPSDHSVMGFLNSFFTRNGDKNLSKLVNTIFRRKIELSNEKTIIIKYRPYAEEISNFPQIMPLAFSLFFMVTGRGRKSIIMEEAGTLMSSERESSILANMVRHSRHFETSIMLISQALNDFLSHPDIIENSRNVFLFRQSEPENKGTWNNFKNYGDLPSLQGGTGYPYSECYHVNGRIISKIMVVASENERKFIDFRESSMRESREPQTQQGLR